MIRIKLILFFLVLFLGYALASLPYYSGDLKNHLVWGQSILNLGPINFYDRDFPGYAFPNYPPLTMFSFAGSLICYQFIVHLINFLNNLIPVFPSRLVYFVQWENVQIAFLKLPQILATLSLGYLIFKLANKKYSFNQSLGWSLLFFLNPAVLYLTVVWGQIDLVPIAFISFAFYFLHLKKYYWSFLLAGISLLTKQTVIVFWGIYLIDVYLQTDYKKTIQAIIFSLLIFYLSYLPFHSLSLTWPFELYYKNFTLVAESVGENAFNLWGLLYNFERASDTVKLSILTLQEWGYLMFGVFILPAVYLFYKQKLSFEKLIPLLLVISLSYFFFLTRMHERYLIPAVVFGVIASIKDKRYLPVYIYISILHFLNLYHGLYQFNLSIINSLLDQLWVLQLLVIGFGISLIVSTRFYFRGAVR